MIVSNHIYFINHKEITITYTRPFIQTNECILILNSNKKTEYINILLANKCCELNKAVFTTNTNNLNEIIEFVRLLGYIKIKIFMWTSKLNYLDTLII